MTIKRGKVSEMRFGPPRAADFGLGAHVDHTVDQTAARNMFSLHAEFLRA
jgi:hypothetical protein